MQSNEDLAQSVFGRIVDGQWSDGPKWCGMFVVPSDVSQSWINTATGKPTEHIWCNIKMHGPLFYALNLARERGLLHWLKTFDGCLNIRRIRGEDDHWSAHSWAMAIDINASTNRLGTDGDMNPDLAMCFEEAGFTWGKNFSRKDPQHFSLLGF